MCLELKSFVDRISQIYPAIESARPRCTSGVLNLCSLGFNMDKSKLIIQHCATSSKLYLAITAKKILLQCEKILKALDLCLGQIQNLVPTMLAAKISGIIEDIRNAKFHLESSEDEAGKAVLALIRRRIPASSDCFENSELEALRLASSSLKITSWKAISEERSCIKRLLVKVHQTDPKKERILKYLLNLLRKYGELIHQDQTINNLPVHKEQKCQPTYPETFIGWHETQTQADGTPKTPHEFECPISTRIMYDPVIIASGKTYERVWIEKWFSEGNETCPSTDIRLENLSLTPNAGLKALISKWCSQHEIIVYDPRQLSKFAPVSSLKSTPSKSVASFGSSMNDLHYLQLSNVSLQSSDAICGSHFTGDDGVIRLSARLPPMKEEICTRHSCTNCSSIGLASISNLASLPWKSQCKAVQDIKEGLDINKQACDCMFSDISMNSLIGFLKVARDSSDVIAQKDSADVILAILSEDRVEMPDLHEDSIYVLASFLDSKISRKALAIMELLSRHQFYKSAAMGPGVLPSILKILGSQNTGSHHELAMKILCNVSCSGDIAYHIVYLDFIPNLVPFLRDPDLSGYCLTALEKLCRIEEGRIAIVETDPCITSMAQLLETGSQLEQETTMEVLCLCYEELDGCQLVRGGGIIQSLLSISACGTSRGKSIAKELLQLLGHAPEGVNSEFTTDVSSSSSDRKKGRKSSSIFGYLGKKISGFFH
uniref:RING-type E3 ubiquitin transferase n=1 Tax=Salix viminalis TaxID=40686 RepID=A0A6N2LDM8_SALVM